MLPVVLSIAGSDSSCGAGAQADLKTVSALGCHGLTAVTCIVAETPGKVRSIQAVRSRIVRDQMEVLLGAYPVSAIKTGMLFSAPIIRTVAAVLESRRKLPPIVLDPVMVATGGHPLLRPGAVAAYRKHLFPLAALLTPNLDELGLLTGTEPRTVPAMLDSGRRLFAETGVPVLLKGGHLRGKLAIDILIGPDGSETEYSSPFLRLPSSHGTGCTYSSAIAAGLASGLSLTEAVGRAKEFITRALAGTMKWGGVAALDQVQSGLIR